MNRVQSTDETYFKVSYTTPSIKKKKNEDFKTTIICRFSFIAIHDIYQYERKTWLKSCALVKRHIGKRPPQKLCIFNLFSPAHRLPSNEKYSG